MNSFSLISDATRNAPFALALKSNNRIKFYGVHALGEVWADEMNVKNLESCCWDIPSGMTRTEFRNFKNEEETLLMKSFNILEDDINTKSLSVQAPKPLGSFSTSGAMFFLERHLLSHNRAHTKSATVDGLQNHTGKNRQRILDYKVKSFVLNRKISSFAELIKIKNLGFNEDTNLFKNKPSNQLENYFLQKKIDNIGLGAVRRFGRKTFVPIISESSNRRVIRRAQSLHHVDGKAIRSSNFGIQKHDLTLKHGRFFK